MRNINFPTWFLFHKVVMDQFNVLGHHQFYEWLHFQRSLLCVFISASRLKDTLRTAQEKDKWVILFLEQDVKGHFPFKKCGGVVLLKLSVVMDKYLKFSIPCRLALL